MTWHKLNKGDIIKSNTCLVFKGRFSDLNYKRLIVEYVDLTGNTYSLRQKTLKKRVICPIWKIDTAISNGYIDIIKQENNI